MPQNPVLAALMRLQPTARRVDLPDEEGFDDDLAIQGFASRQRPADPRGALRDARRVELEERIFNEMRAPSGSLDALKYSMGLLQKDEAADPIQQEIAANQKARLEGFPSAAQAGQFEQELAQAKTLSPLRVAQTQAQANVRGREIGRDQAVQVADIKARQERERYLEQERTRRGNTDLVRSLVEGGKVGPGGRVSTTGTGGMAFTAPPAPRTNVNSLVGKLADERARTDSSPAAIAQLEQGILGGLNLDPDTLDVLYDILNDPSLTVEGVEDLEANFDLGGLDPLQILNVLNMVRGQAAAPASPEDGPGLLRRFFGGQ